MLLGLSESPLLAMLTLVLNWLKRRESLWLSRKPQPTLKKSTHQVLCGKSRSWHFSPPHPTPPFPIFLHASFHLFSSLPPSFLFLTYSLPPSLSFRSFSTCCPFLFFFPMAPYPITLFPASSLLACFSALFPHFLPQPHLRNAETKVNLFYQGQFHICLQRLQRGSDHSCRKYSNYSCIQSRGRKWHFGKGENLTDCFRR